MNAFSIGTVMCLAFLLLGCDQQKDVKKLGLVYCTETAPHTFNPQLESSINAIAVTSRHLYDRLVEVDPITQQLIGGVANNWQISDDGLRYRFELRQGIHFHKTDYFSPSRNLNADDVMLSFERILDTNHPLYILAEGDYPFFNNIGFGKNIKKLTKLSDSSVEFELKRPDAAFLANLASDYAVILSAEYAEKLSQSDQLEQLDQLPIGSGPFYYVNQRKDHFIRYYRHWLHWRGAPPMQQLVFDITPTSSIRLAKLLTGQCDIMAQPAANQLEVLKSREELLVSVQAGLNVSYLAFNTQKPPFADVRIRRNVAGLVNKQRILDSVYLSTADIANGVLSPSSWAYRHQSRSPEQDHRVYPYIEKAKQQPIELWVLNEAKSYNPQPRKTAELIRNDLVNDGYQVNVRLLDWQVLRRYLRAPEVNYDLLLVGWSTDNSDPDDFFRQQFSCDAVEQGYNFSRWCNGHFEQLLNAATASTRLADRVKNYYKIQKIIEQDVPILPLTHALKMYSYNDSVHGITWNPYGGVSFNNAYRK
ncbi:ABC transporter substrate-binding protein [Agarivorans litoreus]|uniref:ABC transporter substrate-binding protein n=1 Tax=Agarivorans litoreus TaxID=1510455 RepID=UPI001C7D3F30|nr:ABC transporter substrate-binding protein [Agarivorans litoreus]